MGGDDIACELRGDDVPFVSQTYCGGLLQKDGARPEID